MPNRRHLFMGPLLVVILCLTLFSGTYAAPLQNSPVQSPGAEAQRLERLASLARLWGAIKYFHPYLAYRSDIDWDQAAIEAIVRVNDAKSSEDYSSAVAGMLRTLNDPATRLHPKPPKSTQPLAPADDPSIRTVGDGVLVVSMVNFGEQISYSTILQKSRTVADQLSKAKAVIIDLRPQAPLTENQQGGASLGFKFSNLAGLLTATPVDGPGERRRMHVGFVPQQGGGTGGYESAFFLSLPPVITPAADTKEKPVVFLVNQNSEIPNAVLGLQASGKAAIIAEGPIDDAPFVTTQLFKLADGVEAEVRLGELIYPDGTSGVIPDETVASSSVTGEQNPAFQRALALTRDFKVAVAHRIRVPASAAIIPEKPYAETAYPSREYRVLAAFRIWTVINYFFPYKDLMKEDWDAVLRESIPKLEAAGNALEYNQAVAEMVTRYHDGHGFVYSATLRDYFGPAPSPALVQMIDGVPVIIGFLSETADKDAKESGLEVGDVIVRVDGEDAAARLARLERYMSSSTPQWLDYRAANALLSGAEGSLATVTVRDAKDALKEIKVPRKSAYYQNQSHRRGEPYKLLSPKVGYADLDRLEVAQVDQMFEKFKDTRAIIFDDRTYPRGSVWAIAPRLTDKVQPVGAIFTRFTPMAPEAPNGEIESSLTSQSFRQRIPGSDKWKYHGKTVMLIDERAISHAEHSGLFMEAANGTKFIGSPTAGANGDVTSFCLPGDIWVSFSGQGVRHADGRQLQRIGLQPDVLVRPTLKGIRAARDEVLEKAVEYVNKEIK